MRVVFSGKIYRNSENARWLYVLYEDLIFLKKVPNFR